MEFTGLLLAAKVALRQDRCKKHGWKAFRNKRLNRRLRSSLSNGEHGGATVFGAPKRRMVNCLMEEYARQCQKSN